MSLTINTSLTTIDGGSVESGSHLEFDSFFPSGELSYNINMILYRDINAKNNGFKPIKGVVEIEKMNFTNPLTEQDYVSLTPLVMHEYVKQYLENYLGAGTVTINPF